MPFIVTTLLSLYGKVKTAIEYEVARRELHYAATDAINNASPEVRAELRAALLKNRAYSIGELTFSIEWFSAHNFIVSAECAGVVVDLDGDYAAQLDLDEEYTEESGMWPTE